MMRHYIVMESGLLRKLLLTGIFTAMFLAWFNSRFVDTQQVHSLESLFMYSFGHLDIRSIKYVMPVIFWLAPQIFLLYFLGEYVASNLGRNAVYIFTRTDQRKTWLLAKVVSLFLYVLFYCVVQLLATCLMGIVMGYEMLDWSQGIQAIFGATALIVLVNYTILLLINLLSLRMNVVFSAAIVLAADLGCFFLSQSIYEMARGQIDMIKWLPFTQGVLSWHTDTAYVGDGFSSFQLEGYNVTFSAVYLVVICMFMIGLGIRKVKNMDIL